MAEVQDGENSSAGLEVTDERPATSGDLVSDTLAFLARALVADPDAVRVETFESERGPGYRLIVGEEDMGRVIGRQGRVAKAIRTVAKAAAARSGTHALIEIGR